jgi:thioredoxin reductase (NADPH)
LNVASDLLEKRREQMFPKLTAAQIARLEAHGTRTPVAAGTVLLEPGERPHHFYAVLSGSIELLLRADAGESLLNLLTAGDFTGEMSMLRGSVGFARIRVRDAGIVIAVDAAQLRSIVQTDAELSELFMRAFILRRVALLSEDICEVMLLGSRHSADTLRLREFLTRNACPHVNLDVETDTDVQVMLERFHVKVNEIPVVICRGEHVFRNPSNHDIAECLGMNPQLDGSTVHDLVIVGAGPAGLAAAVYAASEGLDVRIVETTAPGGQAGTSSRIENYLGFPTGISGQALAGRALSQAQKFGANLSVAAKAVKLHCDRHPYAVELEDGSLAQARTVLIASGAQYRGLDVDDVGRFMGVGIYYAATYLEAKLCQGEDIVIVGGGNSAGQAAVFLASTCRHVHVVVRSAGLAQSMSRYLIRRIEESPQISLHVNTRITALEGGEGLERLRWRCVTDTQDELHDIRHLFLMTGADPNTRWLQGCVALDSNGFVKAGTDLSADDLAKARWPLARAPYLQETSRAGVFAAGDVRCGSTKRIASAVGDGSTCVQFVHRALADLAAEEPQRAQAHA